MKKPLYILLTLIFFVAALNINLSIHSNQLSEISLQNIETLSYAETSETCYGVGSLDCPSEGIKVRFVF